MDPAPLRSDLNPPSARSESIAICNPADAALFGAAQKKKAGLSRLFSPSGRAYFFISSGFDSLGEAGVLGEDIAPLELDDELLPVSGAGVEGVGAVVDGDGAGAGAVGAGAGVTTFSSFLQAVRPIASNAAMRSERFMSFPLGDHHTDLTSNGRLQAARATYPIVMSILTALHRRCLRRAYSKNHSPAPPHAE